MTDTNARSRALRLAVTGAAAASALVAGSAVQAEVFGIMNGRSAAPPTATTSAEVAAQFDDDAFYVGLRGNYAVSPELTGFANLSFVDLDAGGDGFVLGGGTFFHFVDQQFLPSVNLAAKPSIGYTDVDGGNVISLAAEAIASGRTTVAQEAVGWYANFGLGFFRTDPDGGGSDTDFEPIIGGGITVPVGNGTAYAGVDIIDDVQLGVGFRIGLQ